MKTLDSFHVGELNLGRGRRNWIEPYITFPPLFFSRVVFYIRFEGPGVDSSSGRKSAGFWIVSGFGVSLCRFHIGPVIYIQCVLDI